MAGSSPAWLPLLGCGGGQSPTARSGQASAGRGIGDIDSLRDVLRQSVADLRRRFADAYGWASLGRITELGVDEDEQTVATATSHSVTLAVWAEGGWRELRSSDASVANVRQLAARLDSLAAGATKPSEPAAAPSLVGSEPAPAIDPRQLDMRKWLERTAELFERARALGTSRVVYRRASLTVEDADELFIGHGRDYAQRCLRSRAVAGFVVFDGTHLVDESAVRAGAIGLEALDIGEEDLSRAASSAMARLTTRIAPGGAHWMLLDPSVAAALIRHAVVGAGAVRSDGEARSALSVTDDPTQSGAFGGYRFDDEGWPARPTRVIEAGNQVGRLTDRELAERLGIARTGNGRRGAPDEPARPWPSHLVVEPGSANGGEMMNELGSGFLIESAIDGAIDQAGDRLAIRARRAREVVKGRTTGRSYGPVVVAGSARAMLAAVRAVGSEARPSSWRERHGSGSIAVSASSPALITSAHLAGGG